MARSDLMSGNERRLAVPGVEFRVAYDPIEPPTSLSVIAKVPASLSARSYWGMIWPRISPPPLMVVWTLM
jgi:hypothetical protein